MRAIKRLLLPAALVMAVRAAFCQPAFPCIPGDTNPPPVVAQVRHEEGPGLLPADRAYINIGADKFAFLVPAGFKLEPSSGRVVTIVSADYSCQISFRLALNVVDSAGALSPELCASKASDDFPGAKIVRSFSAMADSRQGPAFEVQLTGTAGSARRGEIAFIPSRAAVFEFGLVCGAEKFDSACHILNTVMLTFRASDERGELRISPLSDKL